MLRFFRINDPYRLIFIFLILIGVRVVQGFFIEGQFLLELKWLLLGEWLNDGYLMYREAYDYTGPLAAMVYKYMDFLFGRSSFAHHALSSLLIIFQAAMFNGILLRNKAFDENNYLPAFFYVLVIVCIPDFMVLSPQLMSMTFVLKALGSVLRRIDNQVTDELFLNSGLFVGVASLIYLPAAIFFIVFLISLIVFSSAITRRLLLYFFGFLLVFGLASTYFLWRGDFYLFVDYFVVKGLLLESDKILSFSEIVTLSSVLLGGLLIAIGKALVASRLTNFQQRVQQVIWFMFIGSLACFFLSNKKVGLELIFTAPLLSYFLSHYFMLIKKRWAKAIMPALVVFGLIGFNIYCYLNLTEKLTVRTTNLLSDKTLLLDEDFGFYANSQSGSPCFCLEICKTAFEGLGYYEASANIYKLIDKRDPEVIIDRIDVIDQLFYRFPLLEEKYRRDGQNRYKKISN